ncbi:class I SAM-dependent DNA methyltransferase [Ereboglobus luteus]|uniref:site-specific DNA-methyltransferase (adenine-specific) n=1 Tax=Ereboglobus luteus TaxID=1796921 RepID=A0A2U8E4S7_9BACT|nr:DNA methyltransferase [Ereboglobus luteus]AWI09765.1 lactate dehydrogenase [Ereboglobus luteus]
MNAVEIEEAVSRLAEAPFDIGEFPYAFLEAFGNKETTIRRLRTGNTNQSDIGGVLQRNNIHIKTCAVGEVPATLATLRGSPKTTAQKAKFILATDGSEFQAENLVDGSTVACAYPDFHDHFGFFLPLAGITTVRQISENAFDIKATGRLNRLYIELLKENPDWDTEARRADLNHFMARLIFCFFAEDTSIFHGEQLFTATIDQMSARDSSNTHEVISELFRAMNTPVRNKCREAAGIKSWANSFPYVNGGMFSDSVEVPRFSKIARSYLLHIGNLDWTKINPDIFGSMIQAVADDEERGALGMHYTSVPNILKVLNPLFLDDLRARLDEAGDNARKLLNLRQRIARIRVFDPACGSGNFLVIAYKEMRSIEAVINERRGERERKSDIPLTNFRGIEIRHFSCEIARLALIIAKYQCDVLHRGQQLALAEFLPLEAANWITRGNALRLDWLSVCPPTNKGVKLRADDLFETPLEQAEIDFENEGGETYICGNPPYLGSKWQSSEQKEDLKDIFGPDTDNWKSLDYVSGWFMKAAEFSKYSPSDSAFVATNSICQGLQVPMLWPLLFAKGVKIAFAYTSFKWANLATHNAGVIVVIVGLSQRNSTDKRIYSSDSDNNIVEKRTDHINAYLVAGSHVEIKQCRIPISNLAPMLFGNMPRDGGSFILSTSERDVVLKTHPEISAFIRPYLGSEQMIQGKPRWCVWIEDNQREYAERHPFLSTVLKRVREFRLKSSASSTRAYAQKPHRFVQIAGTAKKHSLAIAKVSSEKRPYLPVDLLNADVIVSDLLFAIYDAPLWNMSLIMSRMHIVWIGTVCGKMKTDFRYSNTLGWNTFPVPRLTEINKKELTCCAENILLARESHYPATIADLYDPDQMPKNLKFAHEANDEVVERIYIGRKFKNDSERLEILFRNYENKE